MLKKMYMTLPPFLKSVLITLYGFKLMKVRYGKYYKHYLKHYSAQKYLNLEKEKELQEKKFIKFIKFAKINSKFYKALYEDVDLNSFTNLMDINLLPIMSKEKFRKNIDSIHTIDSSVGISSFTGGTTGTSLEVRFTKQDFQERMAYLDAFKYKLGVNSLDLKATFSGREIISQHDIKKGIYWVHNFAYRQKLYSTFHISDTTIPSYIADLNKFKPNIINGFVSAIYQIAKYVNDNRVFIEFTVKAIFTTSETLMPYHKEVIEKAFNTNVYNQYASAEGAPFITECLENKLHYNLDTGVIEVRDDNSILVTSFTTHGTPLIRYEIGDSITFSKDQSICACGSTHPIVEKINGRVVDYLLATNGNKVSLSHLADVIKGIPSSIKKIQFIQKKINQIQVLICVDEVLFTEEDKNKILMSMRTRFGNDMILKVNKVGKIPLEKSGKYSLIKKTF